MGADDPVESDFLEIQGIRDDAPEDFSA